MIRTLTIPFCCLAFITILSCSSNRNATNNIPGNVVYQPVSKALYDTILHMDSVLSDVFNRHDADAMADVFGTDLEFFHDNDGLIHYDTVLQNFRNMFNRSKDISRQAIPGSIKVYPIKGYGAIQEGEHRFCHMENGKEDCGTFKFLHVWRRQANGWRLVRVVSYGHQIK